MCKYASTKVIKITSQKQADVMNKLLRNSPSKKNISDCVYPSFDKSLWVTNKNVKNTVIRKRA